MPLSTSATKATANQQAMTNTPDREPPEGPFKHQTKPLSHRTTRRLVIAGILLVCLVGFGSAYFLIQTARNASQPEQPVDTLQQENAADSLPAKPLNE